MALRQLDALRRVGVARQEVEAGIGRAGDAAQVAVGGHRLQEARRRERIVAGAARGLDADRVGLELLVARELREPELAADQRRLGARRFAEHVGHDLGGEFLLGLQLLALQAVIGGDVAHLVGDHRRQLGRIIGQRQQPARHVEIAAGQREGVDVRRVEDGDAVGLRRIAGHQRQIADDLGHHALELGVGIFAAIGRKDARMLAPGELGELVVLGDIVDGDGIVGRLEARFAHLAADAHHLAAGDKRRDTHCRGQAQAAAHENDRSIVWRRAGGQDGFLSVRGQGTGLCRANIART